MDFGIAKADVENSFETQATQAIGTPAFMAPEQIRGETVGPAADIYAYGMTLYKIFARDLPFKMTSAHSLLFAHLDATPFLLSQRNPLWPKELDVPLSRAIEKSIEKRPATATKLMEEIEQALKPVMNEPFAAFYGANGAVSQSAVPLPARASVAADDDAKKKKLMIGGGILGGIVLIGIIVALSGGGGDDQRGNHSGVIDNPTGVIPVSTPRPSPTPMPTLYPTPSPEPTATPTPGPTPTPLVIVVTPTVAPSPSRTPPPTRTPRATPTPEPTEAVAATPADPNATPTPAPYAWGRELAGGDRNLELKFIEELVVEKIRRPIYRGRPDDALPAFDNVPPETRDLFFRGIRTFVERYDNVTVKFTRASERIDGRRCDIRMRTGVTAARKGSGSEANIKLIDEFEATAKFEKRGEAWVLIDWPSKQYFPALSE